MGHVYRLRALCLYLLIVSTAWAPAQDLQVATPFVAPKRWALVIGAGRYQDYGELKFASKDARSFAASLIEAYGFPTANVRTLIDDEAGTAPTAKLLFAELDRILQDRSLNKGDLFIFYFSGHGEGTPNGDYLLPTDALRAAPEAKGIAVREVVERIVKAGLKNVLLICDACRAGSENPFGAELQKLGKKANLAVMLGCAPGKRAYEYPSLQQGIFTYMLNRAMKDVSLRDTQTGALWASAVGKKVQKDVADYTERDYGEARQVPALWTEGSSRDVLIGAYIGVSQIAQFGMDEVLKLGKKLDRDSFKFYLLALGILYIQENMDEQAVEAFKALIQLGDADNFTRLCLAQALIGRGRYGEAEPHLLQIVADKSERSVYDAAVLLLNDARTTPEARRAAQERMYREIPDWQSARAWWLRVASLDPVPAAERARVRDILLKEVGENARARAWIEGYDRYLNNDLLGAMEAMRIALEAPGKEPETHDILVVTYRICERLGNDEAIEGLIGLGKRQEGHEEFWLNLEIGRLSKKLGEAKRKEVEAKLAGTLEPSSLLELVVAGADVIGSLLPQVKVRAADHPFAWEAQLALWLTENVAANFPFPPLPISAKLRALAPESEVDFTRDVALNHVQVLENAERGYDTIERFQAHYYSQFVDLAPKIGPRWEVWMTVLDLGQNAYRYHSLGRLAERFLEPETKRAPNDYRLREVLLDMYIGAGLIKQAEALHARGNWLGPEAKNGSLRFAVYLAFADRTEEAAKLLQGMPKPNIRSLDEMKQALELLVEARNAKTTSAKVAKFEPRNAVAMQLRALALAALMPAPKASPKELELVLMAEAAVALLDAADRYNTMYLDGRAAVTRAAYRVLGLLKDLPQFEGKVSNATYPECALEQAGNVLFADSVVTAQSLIGKHAFHGEFRDDAKGSTQAADLFVTVNAKGQVELYGSWDPAIRYQGKVDTKGNLRAAGRSGDVWMKLIPEDYAIAGTTDLRVSFVSPSGQASEFRMQAPANRKK